MEDRQKTKSVGLKEKGWLQEWENRAKWGPLQVKIHIELVWQAFDIRKTTGVMETDLLLAKAEPISSGNNAFVITYFKRRKNCCKTPEKNENLHTPGSEKKEGKELLQLLEQRLPCSLGWRSWWSKLSWRLCQSMGEQVSTSSPQNTPQQSWWMCLEEVVSPWRGCAEAGAHQDPLRQEPMME